MRTNTNTTRMLLATLVLLITAAAAQDQLQAPSQVWPWDNAANVPARQTLAWQAVGSATAYELQLATSESFAQPAVERTGITLTQSTVCDMSLATRYFWRVRAVSGATAGNWSTVRTFNTAAPAPMGAATLSCPSECQISPVDAAHFAWTPVSGAVTYAMQLSLSAGFSELTLNLIGVNDTTMLSSGLQPGQTYFWRVAAQNAAGNGPWSDVRTFSTSGGTSVTKAAALSGGLGISVSSSMLSITLQHATSVNVSVVDMSGRLLLNTSSTMMAGTHVVRLPAANSSADRVAVRVRADGIEKTQLVSLGR